MSEIVVGACIIVAVILGAIPVVLSSMYGPKDLNGPGGTDHLDVGGLTHSYSTYDAGGGCDTGGGDSGGGCGGE